MSFLDEIRSRIPFGQNQDPYEGDDYGDGYEDDYYDEGDGYADGYDDAPADDGGYVSAYPPDPQNGVLGQTRRGEAESVAVYTRSGKLVGDADRHATTYNPPARSSDAYRPGAYDTPSSYAAQSHAQAQAASSQVPTATESRAATILSATPQLPAYILRPESYDDVETVVRRVRTKQPVALVFVGVRTEIAKRVLDFCFGLSCGVNGTVDELGDRVFVVLPEGIELSQQDIDKLVQDGTIER